MTEHKRKSSNEQKPPKKITSSYLQNSGLYYLQRFPASVSHFQFVMNRKIKRSIEHHGTPTMEDAKTMLEKVTDHFKDLGFLNDRLYAQGLASSLFRKGASKKMITARLNQKGLDAETINGCLLDTLPDNAELIAAARLLQRRRYGVFATHPNKQDTQKTMSVLARSGFSYHVANTVMDMSQEECITLISKQA